MQTRLPVQLLATSSGREADRILRSCVHCGFCTATCPTYLLTGNELESPRGRIYLIKELLEEGNTSQITRTHLDSCLSCQSCETTCPSNVQYHTLLNIGQGILGKKTRRPLFDTLKRKILLAIFGSKKLFGLLVLAGKNLKFLLPVSLSRQLPGKQIFKNKAEVEENYTRQVVLLEGCVQGSLSPDTSAAVKAVLHQLGIGTRTVRGESCCGAMHYHSGFQDHGVGNSRQLIDQLLEQIENGVEAIISSASGCGNFIKDYSELFRDDGEYLVKAEKLRPKVKDIAEFLQQENLSNFAMSGNDTLAFHSPCTLQHGQQMAGVAEDVLRQIGYTLPAVADSHICCGSAGTYSLFQPVMARQLGMNKIKALESSGGKKIATANIGCQCHLGSNTTMEVRHWVEYVAMAIAKK